MASNPFHLFYKRTPTMGATSYFAISLLQQGALVCFAVLFMISGSYGQEAQEWSRLRDNWFHQTGLSTDFSLGNLTKFAIMPNLNVSSPRQHPYQWDSYINYNFLLLKGSRFNNELDVLNQFSWRINRYIRPTALSVQEHSSLLQLHFRSVWGAGLGTIWTHTRHHYFESNVFFVHESNDFRFSNRSGEALRATKNLVGPVLRIRSHHQLWRERIELTYDLYGFYPLNESGRFRANAYLQSMLILNDRISVLLMTGLNWNIWTPPRIKKYNLYNAFGISLDL